MANILCIDAAFDDLCVVLSYQTALFQAQAKLPKQHAAHLIGFIKRVLEQAECPESAIDAIAYDAGPASFTGIRMAAGVAMSMGYALQKPVITLSSLPLLANSSGLVGGIVTVLNAYQGEIYVARFEKGQHLNRTCLDRLIRPEQLKEIIQNQDAVISDCFHLYAAIWKNDFDKHHNTEHPLPSITSAQLEWAAQNAFALGEAKPAMQAAPGYLRNDEAWKKAYS